MYGGADQNALAQLVGALEDHMVGAGALALIQQVILAAGGVNVEAGSAQHGVNGLGLDAGGVDHIPGLHGAGGGFQLKAAVDLFHALDGAAAAQLHAVAHGHFDHGQGIFPGAHNGGAGGVKRTLYGVDHMGLDGLDFVGREQLNVGHAVGNAVFIQLFNVRHIAVLQSKHQAAALLVGHIQLCADLFGHSHTGNIQFGHAGAGLGVISGMENGAVGLGGAIGDIVFRLENYGFGFVVRQSIGGCGADHTAANDGNIVHLIPPSS